MAAHVPQQSNVSLPPSGLERAPAVLPLPLHTDLRQIMDTHDSSLMATREATMKDSDHTRGIPIARQLLLQTPMYQSYGPIHRSALPSGNASLRVPHTPVGSGNREVKGAMPSSADANRNTLAEDIIRALRPPNAKRKRDDSQVGGSTDQNVSLDSPLAKKSRTVPARAISHTEGVRSISDHVPDPREGSESAPTAPVHPPSTFEVNTVSVPTVQNFQNNSRGQSSSHSAYTHPQNQSSVPAAPVHPSPTFEVNTVSVPTVQNFQNNSRGQSSSHSAHTHPQSQSSVPAAPVYPSPTFEVNAVSVPAVQNFQNNSRGQSSSHSADIHLQSQSSVPAAPVHPPPTFEVNAVSVPAIRNFLNNLRGQSSSHSADTHLQSQSSSHNPQTHLQGPSSYYYPQTNSLGQASSHNSQTHRQSQSLQYYLQTTPQGQSLYYYPQANPQGQSSFYVPQVNSQPQSSSHHLPTIAQWNQRRPMALPQIRHQHSPSYPAGQTNWGWQPLISTGTSLPYSPVPLTQAPASMTRYQPPETLSQGPSEARSPEGGSSWTQLPERRLSQARSPERESSAASPQKQVVSMEYVSVPNTSTTSVPASRPSGPPAPIDSALPPNVPETRPPLFLPSPESPPSSTTGSPLPIRRSSGLIPVVELELTPRKLKSKARLVQENGLPKTDVSSTGTSLDSVVVGSIAEAEPLFGRPTGALAVASSGEQQGLRRPRSKVYVLIPTVDKRLWRLPITSTKENKTSHSSQKEQTVERKRHRVEDSSYVQDFARRLIRRRCLWKGCHAILDSTEKFLKHVKIMHGGQDADQLFKCHWKECHSNSPHADSDRLIRHLQWHVTARVYCAYEGCDFQTQLADPLAEHIADDHDGNDSLRPIAVPSALVAPNLPAQVEVLPSYCSVPRQVTGRSISKDRHQKIGPWVLHRISDKVDIRKGAVSATVPLGSQRLGRQVHPTADEIPQEATRFELQDEYDFTRTEVPARSFKPLVQLPHTIDEIDVVDGCLLDEDAAIPLTSGPETVNAPVSEEAAVASVSDAKGSSTIDTRRAVSKEAIQGVVKAVREDVESREVEALL